MTKKIEVAPKMSLSQAIAELPLDVTTTVSDLEDAIRENYRRGNEDYAKKLEEIARKRTSIDFSQNE